MIDPRTGLPGLRVCYCVVPGSTRCPGATGTSELSRVGSLENGLASSHQMFPVSVAPIPHPTQPLDLSRVTSQERLLEPHVTDRETEAWLPLRATWKSPGSLLPEKLLTREILRSCHSPVPFPEPSRGHASRSFALMKTKCLQSQLGVTCGDRLGILALWR